MKQKIEMNAVYQCVMKHSGAERVFSVRTGALVGVYPDRNSVKTFDFQQQHAREC